MASKKRESTVEVFRHDLWGAILPVFPRETAVQSTTVIGWVNEVAEKSVRETSEPGSYSVGG